MSKLTDLQVKTRKQKSPRPERVWRWGWLPSIFFKPRSTVQKVVAAEKPIWQTPLLILSVLVLVSTMIAAPIRRQNIQTGANLPQDFNYWSQDQQSQYLQAQSNLISPTFMYLFPALSGLAGYWATWFILASLLHLSVTLAGSRANRLKASNLVAWAMVPFAIRIVLQIITMLTSHQLVSASGLAYLIPEEASGGLIYLRGVLSNLDAYWVFMAVLIFLGVRPFSGLSRSKAVLPAAITLLIMLLLQGVPSLVSTLFSGLSGGSTPYFFF